MANSYDRRINLYINGKEVQNNLASIQKAMYQSTNELRRMTIGTDEYNKKAGEVKKLKTIFAEHQNQLKATITPLQKLTEFAKGLLPAFSFAAIAGGAKFAFDQVIKSTDTLSTQWAVFMAGMREATNEFWRTLATGNWENFFSNMRSAISVGREYERVLDDLEAKQRALTVAEADARMEMRILEDTVRNVSLSNDIRVAAAEKRIKLEEELSAKRSKIAQQEYNNEVMMAKQASKLNDEKLQELIRDLDSEKKIKAEAYNALQDELRNLEAKAAQKGASTGVLYPGMQTRSGYSAEIENIVQQMAEFSPEVVDYAADLKLLGNVTDEQLNKMVTAYEKLKGAEVSYLENTKRVRSAMYSIFDEENRKKATGSGGATTTGSEPAGMPPMATVDQVSLVEEKQIEFDALKAMEAEYTAYIESEVNKQIDIIAKQFEIEKEIAEARAELRDLQVAAAGDIANALAGMFEQGSAAQIAMIAIEKSVAIAQIWINYAREMSAINLAAAQIATMPFVGPMLAAGYLATNSAKAKKQAAINTGIVVASAVASGISSGKRKKTDAFAAGGFTHGAKMYVAGEAGTEWIAPNSMVKHPATAPIIAALENMRTNRLSPAAIEAFAAGGYSRKATTISGNKLIDFNFSNTSSVAPLLAATAKALEENTKATREFMNWKPKVYTEMIKKDLENLDKIQKTRGL